MILRSIGADSVLPSLQLIPFQAQGWKELKEYAAYLPRDIFTPLSIFYNEYLPNIESIGDFNEYIINIEATLSNETLDQMLSYRKSLQKWYVPLQ